MPLLVSTCVFRLKYKPRLDCTIYIYIYIYISPNTCRGGSFLYDHHVPPDDY